MKRAAEPRRCLVTGAGRGLGLEFARQWLARGDQVFALARDPRRAHALAALAREHPDRLVIAACDVASDVSVEEARRAVRERTDRLDIVVNNAGVFGTRGGTIEAVDLEEIRRVFEVNALGAIRISRSFMPLLRKGERPRLVHITSGMGSVSDNSSGGYYAYRIGKTALNMIARNLAHDLKGTGVASVALSPGWVRTDMGGAEAPLSPQESVASLVATIEGLGPEQSGGFFDRTGKPIPA